jgi:hypothetical protein
MWYIILGYLLVSALFALLFWLLLIAAKRKEEETALDLPEEQAEDSQPQDSYNSGILISPNQKGGDNPFSVPNGAVTGKGNRSDQHRD